MNLTSLEEKAVEIKVEGIPKKVVEVRGVVGDVQGFNELIRMNLTPEQMLAGPPPLYQKFLSISLEPETCIINLLRFKGTSPVKGGDIIRAGLILGENVEKGCTGEALYVDILEEDRYSGRRVLEEGGSLARRDFIDGYNPTHSDAEKLGLTSD